MKICPQCKYERTKQDNLLFPDYECPSCGIIFEKDKAKQELAELEKQRQIERQAKQVKLKKEEERKRKEKEELLKRQEQERNEIARLQKLEAERERQEKIKRKREEEEEKLKKEAEKQELQEQLEKQRKEEEEKNFLKRRQEKITRLARENKDKIISSSAAGKVYQLFDMCPFGMAQTGKGLTIVGFGDTKNKLQHARCMQKYCRLWTIKTDERGAVYAQGCSLQFLGLSKEEISENFSIKNMQILEDEFPENREPQNPGDLD